MYIQAGKHNWKRDLCYPGQYFPYLTTFVCWQKPHLTSTLGIKITMQK
ncbi:hypothetical protein BTN49_0977 [Candidatus Enterovibrio escicola]|uniref:Uncharacterized protein n=1 Tax=Candidatus Enterovibrio escicola TaxID=1927127 RepID=A0A2A5T5I9_9GAMM|nr:hypothetical protein BTN49_0977 [Candidatus Enterovibrio escacola]